MSANVVENPFLVAMGISEAQFKLQVENSTISQLQQKLLMLGIYKSQLLQESDIDVMSASESEIMEAIAEKSRKTQEAAYIGGLIQKIQEALTEKVAAQNKQIYSANAEANWNEFRQKGIEAKQKIAEAIALIGQMKEMSRQLSSLHFNIYGQYILDDRLPIEYQFPKIEEVGKSFIIHNEHLPMI